MFAVEAAQLAAACIDIKVVGIVVRHAHRTLGTDTCERQASGRDLVGKGRRLMTQQGMATPRAVMQIAQLLILETADVQRRDGDRVFSGVLPPTLSIICGRTWQSARQSAWHSMALTWPHEVEDGTEHGNMDMSDEPTVHRTAPDFRDA